MFAWHVLICDHHDRMVACVDPEEVTDPNEKFGLALYYPSAFTADTADCNAYDTEFLGNVFAFLSMHGTANLMKKAIIFYNAHLRAEHRIRMQHAGNKSAVLGLAKLGNNSDIKRQVTAALGRTAVRAMELCIDLHSSVDSHITDDEVHRKSLKPPPSPIHRQS